MPESVTYRADTSPIRSPLIPGATPIPRRSRAMTLTRVDRRGRMGKRIDELRGIYVAALGGPDGLSPIRRMRVAEAAELKALAEMTRGDYLRTGSGVLDDIVRIERKASAAERALGIVEKAEPQSESPLVAHFSRPPSREGCK